MSLLIGWVMGVAACMWLATLPSLTWLSALAIAGVLASCCLPHWRGWWRLLAGMMLGLCWGSWHAEQRLAALRAVVPGTEAEAVLVLRGLPQAQPLSQFWLVQVEQVLTPGAKLPPTLQLRVLRRQGTWPVGSRWRVRLRVRPAAFNANPYGFDAEQWLWAQGWLFSAQLVGKPQRLADAADASAWLDRLRARAVQRIDAVLGPGREAALIAALTVGEQRAIARAEWQLFARTGVTHLVSISGLHVGIVAGLVACLARRLLRVIPSRRVAPRGLIALAGMLAAGSYALLAGWSVPTRRTFFMLAVGCGLLLWRRVLAPFQIWWLALAAVLLFDPFAVYFPGLWLSFGLVAALMLAACGQRPIGTWRGWLRAQWAASAMSIAPLVGFFSALPLVSPLANLLAIPWVSVLLSPLCLLAAALPLDSMLHLAAWLCRWFYWFIEKCAQFPMWWLPDMPLPLLGLSMLGTLCLISPFGWFGRGLGVCLLLPLGLYAPERPAPQQLRVVVFDVGQGLAVWLRTARHDLLYDTGMLDAERVLLPNLRAAGVRRLDALVLSHHDADHDGAAPAVREALPIAQVLVGQQASAGPIGIRAQSCRAGQRWHWDGVQFEVLWPQAGWQAAGNNPHSCVLRVQSRYGSLLLAGDIPQQVEQQLLADYGARLASTVLIVPHHGSRSSSSLPFLQAVAPRWGLVSAGRGNRYGHPHAEVLQRYRQAGIEVWRTDQVGALTLDIGPGLHLSGHRGTAPRHWRMPPLATDEPARSGR